MEKILEPVFLNEKMLLNTAAHLFKGYALKEEVVSQKDKSGEAKTSLGTTFLSKLFSPISVSGEISGKTSNSIKSERLYTLGGLHMSTLEELKKQNQLSQLNITEKEDNIRRSSFLRTNAILKPVDFYEIIQLLSLLRPLLVKLFNQFGDQLLSKREDLSILQEIPKYDKVIKSILKSLEADYLKSKQIEMIMFSPKTDKPIGILDIDLDEIDPVVMKSKLNNGQFYIVGKLVRYVNKGTTLSLVQRTSISTIIDLLEKFVSISEEANARSDFNSGISQARIIVEKVIPLNLPGPSVRILALSVSA